MRFSHHSHQQAVAHRRRAQARQKGYVLVMFALLLIPMLLMAGFSVDVGLWYNRVADMRKAADAAALAGVVWLPDETAARNAALDAAARNGFTNGGSVTVTAIASPHFDRQIQVTITDTQVGSFFYQNLGGRKIPISRTSYAEYVLPVPMGSPRNFFGTGRLLGPAPLRFPGSPPKSCSSRSTPTAPTRSTETATSQCRRWVAGAAATRPNVSPTSSTSKPKKGDPTPST